MKGFSIVVSLNPATYGIGRGNQLPWRIKEDMAFFKSLTTNAPDTSINAVIMGRKTWESLPSNFRPLPGRKNIVLSRDANIKDRLSLPANVLTATSLVDAIGLLNISPTASDQKINDIFIIGGESIYREALNSDLCRKVYVTEVYGDYPDLDTFFPVISAAQYQLTQRSEKQTSSNGISYRFSEYSSHSFLESLKGSEASGTENPEEKQYLDLCKNIIERGTLRGDRTGTGTFSKFGVQMRFSLRNGNFPLITTKKVFWRGVAEELLWFIKGSTNAKELQDKGIHIWDGNGSRQFLDSCGLYDREEMDLGPVYGFQWRHFGAKVGKKSRKIYNDLDF